VPFTDVRGAQIHFEVAGDNGPWLALTTGGRRGFREFVPLARRIAASGFRVLLHDRRNTGASQIVLDPAERDGEEEIWADDLYALLQQLGALPAFVGGSSSGARMSILVCLRHSQAVRALLLMRVTGGEFAEQRLPENYYGRFIRTAREGGMAAVCATEPYQERIAANPRNGEILMATDPERFIQVMSRWLEQFTGAARSPVMGVSEADLGSIRVPALVIPGNDKTHSSLSGLAAQRLIPGAELHRLPIEDQDVPLIPFEGWAQYEPEIAQTFVRFMQRVLAAGR
jgi:pimeloyl-ACP methyl ester carboxylesterase